MITHFRYNLICPPLLVVRGEHYFKHFLRRLLRERNKKRPGKKIDFEAERFDDEEDEGTGGWGFLSITELLDLKHLLKMHQRMVRA